MNTCGELKNEYDRFYRQLTSYQIEEKYTQNQIKLFKIEIQKLERQWKKDVSQKTYGSIIEPIARGLDRKTIIPLDKFIYKNAPSQKENAKTYNYIQGLRDEVNAYNMRLKEIRKNIDEIQMRLRMIDREMRSSKC